jgi:large subunit ribosomal protein L24
MAQKFRIRKGDAVCVISGKDKGKSGSVLKVLRQDNRVLVQGINLVKKHQKQTFGQEGGIIQKEASIHISNVAHVDPCIEEANPCWYEVFRRWTQGTCCQALRRYY